MAGKRLHFSLGSNPRHLHQNGSTASTPMSPSEPACGSQRARQPRFSAPAVCCEEGCQALEGTSRTLKVCGSCTHRRKRPCAIACRHAPDNTSQQPHLPR